MKVISQCPYCHATITVHFQPGENHKKIIKCQGDADACERDFVVEVKWLADVTEFKLQE